MKRYLLGVLTGGVVAPFLVWLVASAEGGAPPAPTGYTLGDIYQFIVSNGGRDPIEGDHSLYPSGAPGEVRMPTTAEIMVELRKRLPCHGGGGGVLPATGQTKCYSGVSPWNEIDCASVDFPGQDGFYQAGCPMEERFVDNGDGTVTDNCTGLMWQKDTAPGTYNWPQALQYCENLELAGHTDWRPPNVRELQSIVDYGRWDSAIDPVFGAVPPWYWSSSTCEAWGGAWWVDFSIGIVDYGAKDDVYYVRAVRGGT